MEPIIEIEEAKKPDIIVSKPINSGGVIGARQVMSRGELYFECELCNKKFTKMNFESHYPDCKQKYKDKKNGGFNSYGKPNFGNMNGGSPLNSRKPMMPAVMYGGLTNKPNFKVKFGKV